jgi:membrane dipeptidase
MRPSARLVAFLLGSSLLGACAAPSLEARAHALAQRFLIVDGHIDVPYRLQGQREAGQPVDDVGRTTAGGDFDAPRARAGGLDAPFFSIYTPAEAAESGRSKALADELIDTCDALIAAHPETFALALSAADVRRIAAGGRIALLYGMENGSPLEGSLANLEHFQRRGVRYVTLCHGKDNDICDSSYDARRTHDGLSSFGLEVVRRMNELGVLIDVSHVSDASFWDVLAATRAPVIASHSSLRHFVPNWERNLSDEMVVALARNGGVAMINFGSTFLTHAANAHHYERTRALQEFAAAHGGPDSPESMAFAANYDREHPFPRATVADAADHVERVIALAGIQHVGLGSDFDGVGDSLPTGLEDVSKYPNLLAELLRRGHSEADLAKLCGENALRVLAEAERVARELTRP